MWSLTSGHHTVLSGRAHSKKRCTQGASFVEYVPLVEFIYFVFTLDVPLVEFIYFVFTLDVPLVEFIYFVFALDVPLVEFMYLVFTSMPPSAIRVFVVVLV